MGSEMCIRDRFYVKWWNLTVPKCIRLRFWTHRIVHIDPRVLQVPFRGSEKQHTSFVDLPVGKIGQHMGQNGALALAWGALFRNGAVAYTKCRFWRLRAPKPPLKGAMLQGLCCRGCAARAMLQWLCCRSNAARIMLQGQCYRRNAARVTMQATLHRLCRTWYAARALLQGQCCRGSAARVMLQMLCCAQGGRRTTR